MQDNILTWNLENWITITLMAALGFTAAGAALSFAKRRKMTMGTSTNDQ